MIAWILDADVFETTADRPLEVALDLVHDLTLPQINSDFHIRLIKKSGVDKYSLSIPLISAFFHFTRTIANSRPKKSRCVGITSTVLDIFTHQNAVTLRCRERNVIGRADLEGIDDDICEVTETLLVPWVVTG